MFVEYLAHIFLLFQVVKLMSNRIDFQILDMNIKKGYK